MREPRILSTDSEAGLRRRRFAPSRKNHRMPETDILLPSGVWPYTQILMRLALGLALGLLIGLER